MQFTELVQLCKAQSLVFGEVIAVQVMVHRQPCCLVAKYFLARFTAFDLCLEDIQKEVIITWR